MPERFPAIEPYETGMLGGQGGGSSPGRRRSFDPAAYRLIQFDQRGCGQSTPPASALDTSLETNTTGHLIGDIEKLRVHLGIERRLVRGSSWGVTLGLYHETGRFFPDEWSCAHCFSHAAWLEDGQLLRDAGRLAGIPGVLEALNRFARR
jgi:pimeloyl-ACP methyl ester carboxylesterase